MSMNVEKFALARKLAHNDKSVRDEAIDLVKQWLDRRKELHELDYLKLWKALYYCMWMSDKPLVQHELAQSIADIVLILAPDRAAAFMKSFFQTMVREWAGTDHLRLDKFLSLIRKMMTSFFKYILSSDYIDNESVRESFIDVLRSVIFVKVRHDTRGIAMHIADVFVDELESALEDVPQSHDQHAFTVLQSLFQLVISIVTSKGLDKILFKRLNTSILTRIVDDVDAVANASDDADVQASNLVTLVLMNAGTLVRISFEAGSDPGSAERSRAPLYELRKRFISLQAQVEDALMDPDSGSNTDPDSDPEPEPEHNSFSHDNHDHHHIMRTTASSMPADTDAAAACLARCNDHQSCTDHGEISEPTLMGPNNHETETEARSQQQSSIDDVVSRPAAPEPIPLDSTGSDHHTEPVTTDQTKPIVNETQASNVQSGTGSGRRHRRRKQSQLVSIPADTCPETPVVKRPKSQDAGGSAAPIAVRSGDVAAGDELLTPKTKSVHFSTTKSVRRFNKRVPMKVAVAARELISKKPQGSALKSKQ